MNQRSVATAALLLACAGAPWAAAETTTAGSALFPEKSITLFADGNANTASGILFVHNKQDKEDLKITLTAGDFVSSVTNKGQNAKTVFHALGDTPGQAIFKATVPKSSQLPVRVEVSNVWEAGESKATLFNDGAEIGHIMVLKYRPPFNVKLAHAPADKPEIVLHKEAPQQVTLKNDDGMTYTIRWTMAVDGDVLAGGDQELTISPNSSTSLSITPNPSWFTPAGLIREETRDGTLTLAFRPAGSTADPGWPSKVIPIKVRLHRLSEFPLQLLGYAVISVLLFCGGTCCLLLRHWVPNRLRRAAVKERLGKIGDRIRELSQRLDSHLQVSLRVARHGLERELYVRWSFSAELPAVLDAVAKKCDALEKLIEQAKQIDRLLQVLDQLRNEGLPPKRLDDIEARLVSAADLLASVDPPAADIKGAQDLMDAGKGLLERIRQEDKTFAKALIERRAALESLRQPADPPTTPPSMVLREEYEEYKDVLTELFQQAERLHNASPENLKPEEYGELNACVTSMELIRDYAQAYRSLDADTRQAHTQDKKELLAYLAERTPGGLQSAKRMVRQLREKVFPADIENAIKACATTPLSIKMDPRSARQFAPMYFSIEFSNPALNSAAALEAIQCRWDFQHMGLTEPGWKVWHYFPMATKSPQRHEVSATFTDSKGKPIGPTDGVKLPVEIIREDGPAFGDRNWAELVGLLVALGIALLGLLAGAREQLLKLDLIPAMVAVFLLGFGADSIKGLLAPKPQP